MSDKFFRETWTERILITKEWTKKALASCVNQRSISKATVMAYASDMVSGRWYDNGVPIIMAYDSDGTLHMADGQHRCAAVIESGVPIMADVRYVPSKNARGYDQNRVRSIVDEVRIAGCDNAALRSNQVTAAITFLLKIEHKTLKPSKYLVMETMNKMLDACEYAYKTFAGNNLGLKKAGVYAAIITVYENGYPIDMLEKACNILKTGIPENNKDIVIIRLRDALITMVSKLGFVSQYMTYCLVLNALWHYERGDIVRQLKTPETPRYPLPKLITEG